MKLILSRKGVDSSSGGFASPVFPDRTLLSIPIPDPRSSVRYRDIETPVPNAGRFSKLVSDLSKGKLTGASRVHVDPDLDRQSLPRPRGWQSLFGQCGAAQSHLQSHAVGEGDIFLFFGWFRQVESYRRRWRYVAGTPDQHVIYGWMQVQSVHTVEELTRSGKPGWMLYHPHCLAEFSGSNVIYRAGSQLMLDGSPVAPGAGVFKRYRPELCLTQDGSSRSHWQLPLWMHPQGRESTLSYHNDLKRWQREDQYTLLKSVARGQEFVLDLEHYPEGISWLRQLISCGM